MIKEHEWRRLIYELSEQHPNGVMLQFAIQSISDAGFHTEIAELISASTYVFPVFNRYDHRSDRFDRVNRVERGFDGWRANIAACSVPC
jgi:hypothetical protein